MDADPIPVEADPISFDGAPILVEAAPAQTATVYMGTFTEALRFRQHHQINLHYSIN
ncbi:MAG: hypothetical protein OXO51_03680 [Gemmatimonadota bacterium]|nr:hypothetical protein [Gemmatimonadota bacterium]